MPNIRHHVVRLVSVVIIYTLLGQCIFAAAPDAPAAIAGGVSDFGTKVTQAWKSMDVSQYYDIKVPAIFTTLTRSKAKSKPKTDAQFDRIEISQRDRTVVQGEAIDFVATAYRGEQSVGGVAFRWSIRKAESGEARPLSNGRFRANVPGRYILQVASAGFTAETNVTVLPDPAFNVTRIMRKPERDRTPADLKQIAEWNASGVLTTHPVSYTGHQAGAVGKAKSRPKAKAKAGDDANRINSVDPIGWDNTNYASAVAPVNFVGRPIGAASEKGAANGNYNLTIPAVNLDGRGDLGVNLNLEYNSRLWSISGTEMTYNADSGYPAPGWNLGYGKMLYTGTSGGCIFVSPDGTRHSPAGSSSINTYGSVTTDTFTGYTTDGSMIEYGCQWYNNSSTSYTTVTGWAQLPNGTTMTFNSPSSNFDMTFPTRIVDRHGNYIDITYEGGYGPAIDTIVDTLGRTIDFNYNGTALRSISGPGYNGATRTFIRFEYFHQSISTTSLFGSPITTTTIANSTPYQLKAIFYPTTTNGYWFCGTSYYSPCGNDAYSDYGIISTVLEQRGMNWNSGPDTIDWGTTNRSRVYDFPATASSVADSPVYGQMTETFDGIDTSALNTYYSKSTGGGYETVTVTRPDGSKLKQKSNLSDGLQVENRIENSSSTVLDKVETTLSSGGSGDFFSPRPTSIVHTDDKNQVTKTDFTYGTSVYNQVTVQKEYDYPGTSLYREKRYTYENGSSYTNRNVLSLVKSESVYDASNNRLSLTEYNYDQGTPIGITDAYGDPDAIVHLLSNYNPGTNSEVEVCLAYNNNNCTYEGEFLFDGEQYIYCECTDSEFVSVYDYLTNYRGNVTEVITYADADSSPSGAIDYDYTYDAAGNQRTTTTNCCQQIGSDYTVNTQYSMPASITKGSSNPMSSERITQSLTYDANTKIPTAITDLNGLTTTIAYDAVSRPTLVTINSGGKKATTYNDSSLSIQEHVKKADNTTVNNSTVYFNGRGQTIKNIYQAGASNYNATSFQYDDILRKRKVSRPYDSASSPSYWGVTEFDILGRVVSETSPDTISTKTMTYNPTPTPTPATSNAGQTVTSTDAWGRQRWTRYDAFGRLAEVVEPDPAGSTGAVSGSGAITTTYAYDQLDRLTGITQGSQTRSFAYDSLGRMTFQKMPEQEAYINSSGGYNTGTLLWSDAFEYDARSNLTKRTDARGVVTTYDYTVSSSPDPLNRLQSISYSTSGADMTTSYIHPAPTVTFDYMTTGDKTRVKKVTTSGVATEENAFDSEGLIASYELKLNAHTGKPFKTEYTYDTAHRLTQIKYPKRYDITLNSNADPQMLVTPSYDEVSRLSQMNINSDMVNNDVILSDISYNTSGQVTSLKTATAESYPRVEGYTFDAATGLLTGQTVKNAALSSTYLDLSYSYTRGSSAGSSSGSEKTGQMTKITNNLIDDRDRKYEFDALGRLKYAKGGTAAGASSSTANWTQTYTYDRYGNKTATAVSGNSDENGNPVPADGLTSTSTSTSTNRISSFDYDRAGNVIRGQNESGVWQRYQYDAAGRLLKVRDDSSVDIEVFTYGSGRQKLSMTDSGNTTYYVWGGSSIIAEYLLVSSNPRYQKAYVYAGSRLLMTTERTSSTTEKRETHHPDRLGTKRVTNIDSGAEIEQSTLPFGTDFATETSGSTNQAFTSYDRSPTTKLDYAINRTYSSGQGRFTTVDPIGMASASLGNPQSNNLYAYTQNMPTDFVDQKGLNLEAPGDGGGYCIRYHYTNLTGTRSFWGQWQCYGGGSFQTAGTSGQTTKNLVKKDVDLKKLMAAMTTCLKSVFDATTASVTNIVPVTPTSNGSITYATPNESYTIQTGSNFTFLGISSIAGTLASGLTFPGAYARSHPVFYFLGESVSTDPRFFNYVANNGPDDARYPLKAIIGNLLEAQIHENGHSLASRLFGGDQVRSSEFGEKFSDCVFKEYTKK